MNTPNNSDSDNLDVDFFFSQSSSMSRVAMTTAFSQESCYVASIIRCPHLPHLGWCTTSPANGTEAERSGGLSSEAFHSLPTPSYPNVQNAVTWQYLAARESGEHSLYVGS